MIDAFQQCVAELTVQVVRAVVPGAVFDHVRALFRQIVKILRGSSEVLLSVRVVAVRPLVLLIYVRTERCFIEEHHKTLYLAILVEGF